MGRIHGTELRSCEGPLHLLFWANLVFGSNGALHFLNLETSATRLARVLQSVTGRQKHRQRTHQESKKKPSAPPGSGYVFTIQCVETLSRLKMGYPQVIMGLLTKSFS